MITVTFYSFRGGVGRTLALVNTAYILAEKGLKVFLIDFDLEAPGLSLMQEMRPYSKRSPKSHEGLVGFLRKGIALEPIPKIKDLAYVPRICRTKKLKGQIHLLPAGELTDQGKAYSLADLDLGKLYMSKSRAATIEDLKAQIQDDFKPDYLLVDSRTGMTEIGGVCTVHMADQIVALTGLTDQHLEGMALVLPRLQQARPDIAEKLIFVASPVPYGEEELKSKRLKAARNKFAEALKMEPERLPPFATIPYHPELALTEENFMARFPNTPLGNAYKDLTQRIRERNPGDLSYRVEQALTMLPVQPQQAFEIIRSVVQHPDAPAVALGLHAISMEMLDKPDEAEAFFKKAISADPTDTNMLSNYAVFLEKHNRPQDAGAFYKKAIEAAPRRADILGNYAVFLDKYDRAQDADVFFKKAIEADPRNAVNLGNYAIYLNKYDRPQDAETFFKKAIEADPRNASNLGNYADFLNKHGRDEEAFYKRAVETEPRHAKNLGNYALFLKKHNRLQEAEDFYKRAIEVDPRNAGVLNNYANHLFGLGQNAEAESFYKRSINADPRNANALTNYAVLLEKQDRPQDAETFYKRAVEADPRHANNLGNYALFLKRRGQDKMAEKFYRQALDADPRHTSNLCNYANFLAGHDRGREAMEYYKRGIEIDPLHAHCLSNYGWLLYKTHEDMEAALGYTEKALEVSSEEVWDFLFNKALFLLLLHRESEARETYLKALSLTPSDEEFKRVALDDLHEAAEKRPENPAIPAMISWLEKEWKTTRQGK